MFAGVAVGQAAVGDVEQRLESALAALEQRGASRAVLRQQLANAMLQLAPITRRPPAALVLNFADALTSALAGRAVPAEPRRVIATSIRDLLRGAKANFTLTAQLRQALTVAGVDAAAVELISERSLKVGEAIRGPDDLPVQPLLPLPPR
jgi:hypothetical protein